MIFGNLFDFNGNGKLEPLEGAMEFGFLKELILEKDEEEDEDIFDADLSGSDIDDW